MFGSSARCLCGGNVQIIIRVIKLKCSNNAVLIAIVLLLRLATVRNGSRVIALMRFNQPIVGLQHVGDVGGQYVNRGLLYRVGIPYFRHVLCSYIAV